MLIKTRQEALDALSSIMELDERISRIVRITVTIATCLDRDARQFLVDAQSSIIEDGLTHMRKRRKEALDAYRESADGDETLFIVDTEKDELLEQVGTAMDTLRMVEVMKEVFPELTRDYEPWQIARAIIKDEAVIRDSLVAAVRSHGAAKSTTDIEQSLALRVENELPEWDEDAPKILKACRKEVSSEEEALQIFHIIAMFDASAEAMLELLAENLDHAKQLVDEIQQRITLIQEASIRHTG